MIRTASVADMGPDFIAAIYTDGDDMLVLYSTVQPDEVRAPVINDLLAQWDKAPRCQPAHQASAMRPLQLAG